MALSAADLKGLVPAAVVPMNERGDVQETALQEYVQWLAGQGPVALAINVDTGEGGHLSHAERLRILELVKEQVSIPCVVGVHGPFTAQAVQEAKDLKAAGADALMVFPIVAYQSQPLDPEIPLGYHRAIADVGLPIVLFQLQPALAGIQFAPDVLRELLRIDEVIALKEASFDARVCRSTVQVIREADKDITVLTGNDNFMLESFYLGCDGGLLGFASIMTDEMSEMIAAWHAGDLDRAQKLGRRTQLFADVIFAPPVSRYRARLKEALALQGTFDEAHVHVRSPLLGVPDTERALIEKTMSELDLL